MKRIALLALSLGGCGPSSEAVKFTNMSVTLPTETVAFPVRAGSDAMIANCGACHSPEMILNQPRLTTDQWKATIEKMKKVYKAPIDPAAEPAILAYLETTSAVVTK